MANLTFLNVFFKNVKKCFVLSLALMSVSASAQQHFTVKDNQTVTTKISSLGMTRIVVKDDRIQSARGVEGTYQLTKDEAQGAIFIKPMITTPGSHFNVYVTTESGRSFNLFLHPADMPAQAIELQPLSPVKHKIERWERSLPYTSLVVQLLSNMMNDERPEGYAVVHVEKPIIKKLPSGLTMQRVTLYAGNHLEGEVWCIKNMTNHPIALDNQMFYQSTTRALAWMDDTVLPGQTTYLYQVVSHD